MRRLEDIIDIKKVADGGLIKSIFIYEIDDYDTDDYEHYHWYDIVVDDFEAEISVNRFAVYSHTEKDRHFFQDIKSQLMWLINDADYVVVSHKYGAVTPERDYEKAMCNG